MRSRPLALLAFLAAVNAACTGGGGYDDDDDDTQGSVDVTIACGGAACGKTGTLRVPVYETTCGASPVITITEPAVTLSTSGAGTITVNGFDTGSTYCIEMFLDVDTSGDLSSGDAIASQGGDLVTPDPTDELTMTLDALSP